MRKGLMIMLLALLILAVAGCGKKQEPLPAPVAPRGQQRLPEQRPGNTPERQQFQMPDLIGEVASVDAGRLTIKVAQLPQAPAAQRRLPEQRRGTLPERQPQSAERQLEYTGESKIVDMPEGMRVGIPGRESEPEGTRDMPVTELKTGDIVQIWYSDKEKQVVSRITLLRRSN